MCPHSTYIIMKMETHVKQQRTDNVYTLVIMQLQLWLELPGFVLTRLRYVE